MINLANNDCFKNEETASECLETVKFIFPDGSNYYISEFIPVERSKIVGEAKFKTVFRVDTTNKEDIEGFVDKIGQKSGTSYNKFCGDVTGSGKKVIIRGYPKCHHNVRRHSLVIGQQHNGTGRQPGAQCVPGKNTQCPALPKFTLSGSHLHTSHRYKQSLTQQTKAMYPLEITLDFMHNHNINSADALRYRPVSEEVKGKFIELFSEGYAVSSALAKYKEDLRRNCSEDEFTVKMADRSVVPDYFWVFHFHARNIEKK